MARFRLRAHHGGPPERRDGGSEAHGDVALDRLEVGCDAEVVTIATHKRARLDRLSALGLVPGSRLMLRQRFPTLVVQVGETEVALESRIARDILVRPLKP